MNPNQFNCIQSNLLLDRTVTVKVINNNSKSNNKNEML